MKVIQNGISCFLPSYDESNEKQLVEQASAGSREAMDQLIRQHQRFIYNIALKLLKDRDDAADLTQEVLVKMVTGLGRFKFKSSIRTWLYRIVINQFKNSRRRSCVHDIRRFDDWGVVGDQLFDREEITIEERISRREEIVLLRNKYMAFSLLCLDREQRLVLMLGGLFRIRSGAAAKLLDITPENFRKQLSRTRKRLLHFINGDYTCIERENIGSLMVLKNRELDQLIEGRYSRLFEKKPHEKVEDEDTVIGNLLMDQDIRNLFLLG
jgi:RNA polymerase sigma factor (sigma-70 family)